MLRKINTQRFHSDKEQSQRTAIGQLKFIADNMGAFEKVASRSTLDAFRQFRSTIEPFTDKQKSYIDGMYEKTMKGLGFPSYEGIKSKYGVKI